VRFTMKYEDLVLKMKCSNTFSPGVSVGHWLDGNGYVALQFCGLVWY